MCHTHRITLAYAALIPLWCFRSADKTRHRKEYIEEYVGELNDTSEGGWHVPLNDSELQTSEFSASLRSQDNHRAVLQVKWQRLGKTVEHKLLNIYVCWCSAVSWLRLPFLMWKFTVQSDIWTAGDVWEFLYNKSEAEKQGD